MTLQTLPIPGFVDLQVNGYIGVDFSSADLTEEDCIHACWALIKAGTSVFLPTVVTNQPEVYERNLPLLAKVIALPEFQGRLPGLHLEGPFISSMPGAVGAHTPAWVRPPDVAFLRQLFDWSHHSIRMITIAAEVEGAEQVSRWAADHGINVSIGHSLATASDLDRLANAGATTFTHLGNGLPHTLHKYTNPIWAVLADDRYTAMMIGDGIHVPSDVLKSMIRAKQIEKAIIVSDQVSVAGMSPGAYIVLGNNAILEPSGRFYNPEIGYLVGSSFTLLRCMNYLASQGFWSVGDLLALGFYNPLRLLGITPESIPATTRLNFDPDRWEFVITTEH